MAQSSDTIVYRVACRRNSAFFQRVSLLESFTFGRDQLVYCAEMSDSETSTPAGTSQGTPTRVTQWSRCEAQAGCEDAIAVMEASAVSRRHIQPLRDLSSPRFFPCFYRLSLFCPFRPRDSNHPSFVPSNTSRICRVTAGFTLPPPRQVCLGRASGS